MDAGCGIHVDSNGNCAWWWDNYCGCSCGCGVVFVLVALVGHIDCSGGVSVAVMRWS